MITVTTADRFGRRTGRGDWRGRGGKLTGWRDGMTGWRDRTGGERALGRGTGGRKGVTGGREGEREGKNIKVWQLYMAVVKSRQRE